MGRVRDDMSGLQEMMVPLHVVISLAQRDQQASRAEVSPPGP
jgi:hypothetical protein